MKRHLTCSILLAIGIFTIVGCAGYDRVLFVTKTNIGLDIDDKPPTAEITIARRELAITPTFDNVQGDETTLPLLASFGLTGNFLNPEITSRFAGGEAAVRLAQGPDRQSESPNQSSICLLGKEPDTRPLWKIPWQSVSRFLFGRSQEDTRPFYFATDTAFGLKAAWDGTTGPYPSTVKLGYNRKELAFPPIFITKGCIVPPANSPNFDVWRVTVPSFFASLDNSSTLKEWFASGITHTQFFATGKAASEFVGRRDVNSAMNKAMYPHNELTITPEIAAAMVGGKQTFKTAGGKGQVRLTLMHDTAIAGQFDASKGEYTAGTTPGTYVIGAADSAGNTAIAAVTVHPQLAIAPTSQSVVQGKTLQFSATGGVPPLKFSISDNKSGGGIDENGLYTAGNTGSMTDKVKVSDSASPPNSIETTVNVQ